MMAGDCSHAKPSRISERSPNARHTPLTRVYHVVCEHGLIRFQICVVRGGTPAAGRIGVVRIARDCEEGVHVTIASQSLADDFTAIIDVICTEQVQRRKGWARNQSV
jgi:hypothetical protein